MHLNLINLYQDRFQPIKDFRDQDLAMKKFCDTLQLRFGRCKDDPLAVIKEKGVTSHSIIQEREEATYDHVHVQDGQERFGKLFEKWRMISYSMKLPYVLSKTK